MEEVDSSEVLLPVLQAAVTQCSLPSETQIGFSYSFKHTYTQFKALFAKLRTATITFFMYFYPSVLSVRPSVHLSAWNNSVPTRQIFMKLNISVFSENMSRKFKVPLNLTRIMATLHEDQNTFFIISHSVLLRMRNVSEAKCKVSENTFYVQ